ADASVRRQGVLEALRNEDGAPAPAVVLAELQVVTLPRHAGDDVAHARRRVEPAAVRARAVRATGIRVRRAGLMLAPRSTEYMCQLSEAGMAALRCRCSVEYEQ